MTKKDKLLFVHFILRPPLYAWPVTKDTIVAFVRGYEIGRLGKCNFTDLMNTHLSKKIPVKQRALGWPDQITSLAQKKSLNWITAFKQESLEVLASEESGGLDNELKKLLKNTILHFINCIGGSDYVYDSSWIDRWNEFCTSKSNWFKELWKHEEYKAIRAISREINKPDFKSNQPLKATKELLKHKSKFYPS